MAEGERWRGEERSGVVSGSSCRFRCDKRSVSISCSIGIKAVLVGLVVIEGDEGSLSLSSSVAAFPLILKVPLAKDVVAYRQYESVANRERQVSLVQIVSLTSFVVFLNLRNDDTFLPSSGDRIQRRQSSSSRHYLPIRRQMWAPFTTMFAALISQLF